MKLLRATVLVIVGVSLALFAATDATPQKSNVFPSSSLINRGEERTNESSTFYYSCNTTEFQDTLLYTAGIFEGCVREASSNLLTACQSAGLVAPGAACVCFACSEAFKKVMSTYASYINSGQCGDLLEYYDVVSQALKFLTDYPCLLYEIDGSTTTTFLDTDRAEDLPALVCPDPSSLLCGFTASSVLTASGIPHASPASTQLCSLSLAAICAPNTAVNGYSNPNNPTIPPFCGTFCDFSTGVCDTFSNGTELTRYQTPDGTTIPLSLFDIMCSPTGAYAEAMVSAFSGTSGLGTYWVNLTTTSHNASNNIIPQYSGYTNPPVFLTGSPGMYELVKCLPGMMCFQSGAYYCPGGRFCPSPFSVVLPCPEGSFCPRGSAEPFDCGFLDDCPGGAQTRTQYIGALVAGIVLGVSLLVCGIIACVEMIYMRLWRARIASIYSFEPQDDNYIPAEVVRDKEKSRLPEKSIGEEEDDDRLVLPAVFPIDIAFDNLTVSLKGSPNGGKKIIIHNASGSFPSGQVTAILGGSGAGKTTLVDALLGRVAFEGDLNVNARHGMTLGDCPAGTVGYVPQQDILFHTLTVREVLEHAAAVRLPGSWSRSERKRQVDAVISTLGLKRCEHLIIGSESQGGSNSQSISGGQRKRVSIGIELVANPSVLILDECTTGLDATTALVLYSPHQKMC